MVLCFVLLVELVDELVFILLIFRVMLNGFLPTNSVVPDVDFLELVCLIAIFFVFNKTLADLALAV